MQEGYPKVGPIYINKSPWALVAVIFMTILGIVAIYFGTLDIRNTTRFKDNCGETVGKVIYYDSGTEDDRTVYYEIDAPENAMTSLDYIKGFVLILHWWDSFLHWRN